MAISIFATVVIFFSIILVIRVFVVNDVVIVVIIIVVVVLFWRRSLLTFSLDVGEIAFVATGRIGGIGRPETFVIRLKSLVRKVLFYNGMKWKRKKAEFHIKKFFHFFLHFSIWGLQALWTSRLLVVSWNIQAFKWWKQCKTVFTTKLFFQNHVYVHIPQS